MIQGIVVTVSGTELKKLCKDRVAHHHKRAEAYADQAKGMKRNKMAEVMLTGGDPVANLESRRDRHMNEAAELEFTASHLDLKEKYRLERADLIRLGICKDSHW